MKKKNVIRKQLMDGSEANPKAVPIREDNSGKRNDKTKKSKDKISKRYNDMRHIP